MRISNCTKCNSSNLYLFRKGPNLGLYCRDCGTWLTWVGKKDRREYEVFNIPVLTEQPRPLKTVRSIYEQSRPQGAESGFKADVSNRGVVLPSYIENAPEVNFGASNGGFDIPFEPDYIVSKENVKENSTDIPSNAEEDIGLVFEKSDSLVTTDALGKKNFNFTPTFGGLSVVKGSCGCEKCKEGSSIILNTSIGSVYLVEGVLALDADGTNPIEVLQYCPYCGKEFR